MKGNLRAYLELTVAMVLVGNSVVVGKLMAESPPVGGRADLFLAGTKQAYEQRLREVVRHERGVHLRGDDAAMTRLMIRRLAGA